MTNTSTLLNEIFAAGLGSAFYTLWTANQYVLNRTFDPRYNICYMVRFILGVIGGVVLASIAPTLFESHETLKRFGPGLFALLGGYSAEAVNQVLQRLADVMVAAIKGGPADQVKAKERELKADHREALTELKSVVGPQHAPEVDKLIKKLK